VSAGNTGGESPIAGENVVGMIVSSHIARTEIHIVDIKRMPHHRAAPDDVGVCPRRHGVSRSRPSRLALLDHQSPSKARRNLSAKGR
jgi:hypothetical protein